MAQKNPFLSDAWMPRYDAMTPENCEQAMADALPKAERAFAFVEKQLDISWNGLVLAPMLAVRTPFGIWGTLTHLTSVAHSEAWRSLEEKLQPAIVALSQRVSQSVPIYEGMLALEKSKDLLPWQRHVVSRSIQAMKDSGVGLKGAEKRKFNSLQKALAQLSMRFTNNVLDSEKHTFIEVAQDEAAGIPEDLLQGTSPWKLGIDFATYDAVMRHAECRALRERFWRARATRASSGKEDNAPLIERILKLRQQMAEILGYPDYAHLSTASKMAGTPERVFELLKPMEQVGRVAAKAEDAALTAFAKAEGAKGKLEPWDKPFWSERQAQKLFGYDEEALRAYFPMESVLEGLFKLIKRLFGVTFTRLPGAIHAWHKDVRFYRVYDGKKNLIAGLYFDPYARPGVKNGGAWMNEIRSRDFETRRQLPIAVVCCNQKPPRAKAVATMSLYEVFTLFHEMGHALQELITRVDSPTCSGINNVEWDAVEIASQFLEQFPSKPTLLRSLSKHIKTGKTLPPETIKSIVAKRTYRAGNALLRQLLFAEADLVLHSKVYPRKYKNANACKDAFARKLLSSPMHPDDRFLCAFTHIFSGGYAAGYYSYKWSETLSADIYEAFATASSATEKTLGKRYCDTFLALGGSIPAQEVFTRMMGREPDATAILRQAGLLQK